MATTHITRPSWQSSSVACAALVAGGIGVFLMDSTTWAQRPARNVNNNDPVIRPIDDTPLAFRNIARQALPSIVSIEAFGRGTGTCRGPGPFRTRSTGFVFGPNGGILTSGRMLANADRVRIRLADGTTFLASGADIDPLTDLAVLQFSPALNVPALPLGDSQIMDVGDWVLGVGRTHGPLGTINEQVAAGIISSRLPGPGIARRDDYFQTDLASTSMSPGSPILNLNGEVVGVQTGLGYDEDGAPQNGWVLPSHLMDRVNRQLVNRGRVSRAYLGIGTQGVDSRLAQRLGIAANEGALVNQVLPNSPAASAGFQVGDVVQAVNGVRVVGSQQLPGMVDDLPLGQKVPVTVLRSGRQLNLSVAPVVLPQKLAPASPRHVDFQTTPAPAPQHFNDLGVGVKDLTPAATPVWARDNGPGGVLIEKVQPGSFAAEAGIRPGMVIQRVGDVQVNSAADLTNLNLARSDGRGVLLLVQSSQGAKYVIVGGDD